MIKYFNKEYIDFLFIQRTRLKTEYGLTKESSEQEICAALSEMTQKDYDLIKPYITNSLDNCNILDIGCGLSTIDIALSKNTRGATYYLLDKTQDIDPSRKFNGFNKEYVFYNNMDLLNDFAKNNFTDNNFVLINADEHTQVNQRYTLILSLLSCGWHYSINNYLDYIKRKLTDNGQLVIDVRNNTEESILYSSFHNVSRLFNPGERRHDGGIVGYRYVCSKLI